MNRFSVIMDSSEYLKNQNELDCKKVHSGSLSDISQKSISREESILNKGSLSSLFFKKSTEGPWSPNGSLSAAYTPRPDKTLVLFDKILVGLNEMFQKYSQLTTDDRVEYQDYNEICTKIDNRMILIKALEADYLKLLEKKKEEYDKIQTNFLSVLKIKNSKDSFDLEDSEAYWLVCRDLYVIESTLEKYAGKLQFQIMDLDSLNKINPLDQYELSIRLSETTKFKSKIKIEKSGHQLWDMRNFEVCPIVDDYIYIKFSELKSLNKSIVLIEKKLPSINNLIRSTPSIFTLWLTPVGTIKLKVIVQWNAVLNPANLQCQLNNIDNKHIDHSSKDDGPVRFRPSSTSHRHANKLSVNIENLFRSSRIESNIHSMCNIVEDSEEDKKSKDPFQKMSTDNISSEFLVSNTENNIENDQKNINDNSNGLSDVEVNVSDRAENSSIEKIDENPKIVVMRQEKIDLTFYEDILPNEELIENIIKDDEKGKVESVLSIIPTSPTLSEDFQNEGDIIESPPLKEAAENIEKIEIIFDQVVFRKKENLPEMLENKIEVEINIDSSEIDSIEQKLVDESCKSNIEKGVQEASSDIFNSVSYTIDSVELQLNEDSEYLMENHKETRTNNESESISDVTTGNLISNAACSDIRTDMKLDDPVGNQ